MDESMNAGTTTPTELDEFPKHNWLWVTVQRVSSWQSNRLVTEHQMWLLETPTSSLSET
jgi:hypothetical protein